MKELRESIGKALRDDSLATVGLRALLGHGATPFGVYFHMLPEQADFSTKSYLTFFLLGGEADTMADTDAYLQDRAFPVTAWSEDPDKVDDILSRAQEVLNNLRGVTVPTSVVQLHQIKWESAGPDLFDDDRKVYYRADQYRAYFRKDVIN